MPVVPLQRSHYDSTAIFTKDFSGHPILLEKSVKMTRRLMPSAAPVVLLHSPHLYVTSLRNDWTRCRNALQFHSAPSARP
jgi:hypothetical protein